MMKAVVVLQCENQNIKQSINQIKVQIQPIGKIPLEMKQLKNFLCTFNPKKKKRFNQPTRQNSTPVMKMTNTRRAILQKLKNNDLIYYLKTYKMQLSKGNPSQNTASSTIDLKI